MIQRCKRFTGHFFTVILITALLAGFGGVANGANAVRLQGNVKNIDAQKTRFELCSATECRDIDVSRNTTFIDVNGRASAFTNLVEGGYATIVGNVRGEDNGNGKGIYNNDDSHQSTVDADVVEIGIKIRSLIINGVIFGINSIDRILDVVDSSTGVIACVTVPQSAEILLVTNTGGTTAILFTDLLFRQQVEVHGHYDDTGCFLAQTVLATSLF
jgi:hypothetical protein